MSVESNIIFVANDSSAVNILKPKLVLLREIDSIISANYVGAIAMIKEFHPEVVLLYCSTEQEDCLKLIKTIKSDPEISSTSILLVLREYEQDFVLSAYDEGITDYFMLNSDNAEVLVRTIWGFKKHTLVSSVIKQHKILEDLGVINKTTGFYSVEFCDKIFDNELKNLKGKSDSILILISPSEQSKTTLNPAVLAQAIKDSTRKSDIVSHSNSNHFYILLTETNLQGAFRVIEKIKDTLGKDVLGADYTISGGVSPVAQKSFEKLKKELLNALVEATSTNQEIVIVSEEQKQSSSEWLNKVNSNQKNFKLFKQAFLKKVDKVITPVFFQVQKLYEDKLFKTKIEQSSTANLSSFVLKKINCTSELKITYPGFSKINIDIVHQGLDSPENSRISLDLTELDEKKLTKILEDFIQEFKKSSQE